MQDQDNPKAKRIIRWRESLSVLEDEKFFNIMRTYLGEIHTPFNKTNLIERLSSIFRKEQNQNTIISLLSDFDIKILTVLKILPDVTMDRIIAFFDKDYDLKDIYSQVLNLSDRLLIYSYEDDSSKRLIAINPLLEDVVSPYLSSSRLFPVVECASLNIQESFAISVGFIASLISYIFHNPSLCKVDLCLRKKDKDAFDEIFNDHTHVALKYLNAFLNLGLVVYNDRDIKINFKRLEKFCHLDVKAQFAYLCVSSVIKLSRNSLRTQAQLLLDIMASIPSTGYTRSSILKIAYLLSNRKEVTSVSHSGGRFASIMARHQVGEVKDDISEKIIDEVIDTAIMSGLLKVYGRTEEGINLYCPNLEVYTTYDNTKGLLQINALTNVTIMQGLSLKDYLELISFMTPISTSTVSVFDISHKAVLDAFNEGLEPSTIYDKLDKYISYEIPQGLKFNIQDWYASYTSVSIYKGYVLKVDSRSANTIENNPKVSPYINSKISEGVYLLSVPIDGDIEDFIKASGFESVGAVKTSVNSLESVDFLTLREPSIYIEQNISPEVESKEVSLRKGSQDFRKSMLDKLNSMNLCEQQYECLKSRIERNIIINEELLDPHNVRMELLEVDGMNYAGKLRLIENAIASKDLLEITINSDNDYGLTTYLVKPIMISKNTNDSLIQVHIEGEDEDSTRFFSVSRANKIKIIKTSMFK